MELTLINRAIEYGDQTASIDRLVDALAVETTGNVVLPQNCIAAFQTYEKSLFVFEWEPQVRVVPWRNSESKYSRIALPYVVMTVGLNRIQEKMRASEQSVHVFFRDAALTSIDNPLFVCRLPNVHLESGNVCWGGGIAFPGSALQKLVTSFWSRPFNMDLGSAMMSPTRWHKMTEEKGDEEAIKSVLRRFKREYYDSGPTTIRENPYFPHYEPEQKLTSADIARIVFRLDNAQKLEQMLDTAKQRTTDANIARGPYG